MNRPRVVRILRIAFSATCGIAAVMLCVLWVTSYYKWLTVCHPITENRFITIALAQGELCMCWGRFSLGTQFPPQYSWEDASPVGFDDDHLVFGFALQSDAEGAMIAAPFWCPVMLFATLAALPWIRWRFSLRTLLIATTAIAVLLGLAVYFAH